MALTDPVTISVTGKSEDKLPRVSTSGESSIYQDEDGSVKVTVSHAIGKRKRDVARVDVTKFTTDPFIPAQNVEVSHSVYVVFDRPLAGFSNAEVLETLSGLTALLSASTNAVAKKVIAGES